MHSTRFGESSNGADALIECRYLLHLTVTTGGFMLHRQYNLMLAIIEAVNLNSAVIVCRSNFVSILTSTLLIFLLHPHQLLEICILLLKYRVNASGLVQICSRLLPEERIDPSVLLF